MSVAATGTFLVAAADRSPGPTASYLVLTTDVDAGDPVHTSGTTLVAMDLGDSPVVSNALTSADGLEGAVALRDLRAGELLSAPDLLPSPPIDGLPVGAVHELTIPAPAERSPRQLRRGDRVTVLSTAHDGEGPRTIVAIEDAVILSFEPAADGFGAGAVSLTLAIDDAATVLDVAHHAVAGDLTVVRSTRAIPDVYPASGSTIAGPDPAEVAP